MNSLMKGFITSTSYYRGTSVMIEDLLFSSIRYCSRSTNRTKTCSNCHVLPVRLAETSFKNSESPIPRQMLSLCGSGECLESMKSSISLKVSTYSHILGLIYYGVSITDKCLNRFLKPSQ